MKYIILIICVFFLSCAEAPPSNEELIVGKWDIYHSLRNGEDTKILDKTYFKFDKNFEMTSNLFSDDKLTYELDNDNIIQNGTTTIVYHIKKLVKDSLIIESKIGRHSYQISLLKAKTITSQ